MLIPLLHVSSKIYTCSADKTLGIWDVERGERVRRWKGHTLVVNSCQVARRGPEMVVSGSDDKTIKLWDNRLKDAVQSFDDKYQVTSVCFSDAGDMIYTGGLDNEIKVRSEYRLLTNGIADLDIKVWDLRKKAVAYSLSGHHDTIAGMALSPDGSYLLSNAMDNTGTTSLLCSFFKINVRNARC